MYGYGAILIHSPQLHYYKQNKSEEFVRLLEISKTGMCTCLSLASNGVCVRVSLYSQFTSWHTEADIGYPDHEKDQMVALDTLAAHYVQQARKEKSKDLRKEYFAQVSV